MLYFNLTPIFKARGIDKPFSYLVKAGFTNHAATHILNSPASLRLDHVEMLCNVLVCEPNDLLAWVPNKDKNYPKDHPLYKLQILENPNDFQETLATIPYKQLKEIHKQINKAKEE